VTHDTARPTFLRRGHPYLLLTFAVFTWSCNWILGRGFAEELPPMLWAFARWLLGIVIVLPIVWRYRATDWPLLARAWKLALALGLTGMLMQNGLMLVGLHYTTATNGTALNPSIPVMIILISWLFLHEPVRKLQVLGVLVSLFGVLAIVAQGSLATLAALQFNFGDLIVLGSMLGWAIYTVLLRFAPRVHFMSLMFAIMISGALWFLPFAVAEFVAGKRITPTLPNLGAIAFSTIFPAVIGTVMWNRGVAQVGANAAGLFIYLMPAFGALLAWLILGERLHLYHIAGIALILTGIWITSRGKRGAVQLPGGID
jgi:drug/metabolite transporter (DMT)-like permease